MLEGIKNFFKRADLLLLALCIAANTFGLILVYSATRFQSTYHSLPMKQAVAMAIGIVVFVLCNYVDLEMEAGVRAQLTVYSGAGALWHRLSGQQELAPVFVASV